MDSATKQVAGIAIITIILTLGVLIYFDNKTTEAQVVSQIDGIDYRIDNQTTTSINVSIQFSMTIENYGRLKQVDVPCSHIQSHLKLKNSTTPLSLSTSTFNDSSSFVLNQTYIENDCDGKTTTFSVSENIINEIIVVIPFRFVNGEYNFIWYHSFADTFKAAQVTIDLNATNPVSTLLEAPAEE